MALAADTSWASVARRLGVNETTLPNWVHEHLAEEARAADPLKVSPSEFEELRRLRAENAELKVEKEILREVAAYFARETIRSAASGSSLSTETPGASGGSAGTRWRLAVRVLRVAEPSRFPKVRSGPGADRDHLRYLNRSRRTYGAARVHGQLSGLGVRCGRKRVARLMRASGLVGGHARRRWRKGRPGDGHAPDLVQRNFDPTGADQLWAADVTQFATGEGWLYLAVVDRGRGRLRPRLREIGWPGIASCRDPGEYSLVLRGCFCPDQRRPVEDDDVILAGDGGAQPCDRFVLAGLKDLNLGGDLVLRPDGRLERPVDVQEDASGPGQVCGYDRVE